MLADDPGSRALPVRLIGPQGHGLWQIFAPAAGPPVHEAEAQTWRLLRAADVAVTGVDIDELNAAVTAGPRRGHPDPRASARIVFTTAGAGEPRQMQVPLGYALALAAAFGAPVSVAGQVMDSLAVTTQGEDLLGVFPGEDAPRPGNPREPDVPRFAPRNLAFTDGLAGWEFGGSFRDEHPHEADYKCAAETGTAVVASAVAEPAGFAVLAQSVLAREHVGRTVTFRADVRAEGVTGEAGVHCSAACCSSASSCAVPAASRSATPGCASSPRRSWCAGADQRSARRPRLVTAAGAPFAAGVR